MAPTETEESYGAGGCATVEHDGPSLPAETDMKMPGRAHGVHRGPEDVLRAELVRRAGVRVADDVRAPVGIRVASLEIGGREEPLETLDVAARPARALVLVVARDPLRARRDADLVAGAVVADRGSHRVRAVRVGGVVVTRRLRVEPARVRAVAVDVGVHGVPPVVVVRDRRAVPAAVVRLQRGVVPRHAAVGVGVDDALPGDADRPELRRADARDVPLDAGRGGASCGSGHERLWRSARRSRDRSRSTRPRGGARVPRRLRARPRPRTR